jgi:hypothetical protein
MQVRSATVAEQKPVLPQDEVSADDLGRLDGLCPCCGKALEPTDYYFHAKSGRLIIGGKLVLLTGSETVMFRQLVKAFPKTTTVNDLTKEQNRCRGDGGTTVNNTHAILVHLRRKLEQVGITIADRHYLLMKDTPEQKALRARRFKGGRPYNPATKINRSKTRCHIVVD